MGGEIFGGQDPGAFGGPDDAVLCQCGHPIVTHPIWHAICVTCGYTRLSGRQVPNGQCMGWDPPGAEEVLATGVDVKAPSDTSVADPFIQRCQQEDHILQAQQVRSQVAGLIGQPPAGPPSDFQEQAVRAAAIALGKDDSWFAWDDPTGPRPGMPITAARIAIEAAWDHINWATDAEIRDLTARLAQADRNWEQACDTTEDLEHRLHATEAHLAALEQSERQARSVIALHQQNGCGVQLWAEGLQLERDTARAHLAALEQAARDFLEQAAGGAVHGSSWGEFERTAERLRQVVDGTDRGEAGP
jgi:hypothetical protein